MLSALCSLPCALCPVLSALCSLPCALCPVLSALCSLPCALCPVLSALCSVLCALCSVLCALCSVLCALCSVLCALCSVLCALCSPLSFCHWKCLSDFLHFRSGLRYSDRCLVQISEDYKLDLKRVKAYRLNDKNATPKFKCMLTKRKENYRSRSYREANPGDVRKDQSFRFLIALKKFDRQQKQI